MNTLEKNREKLVQVAKDHPEAVRTLGKSIWYERSLREIYTRIDEISKRAFAMLHQGPENCPESVTEMLERMLAEAARIKELSVTADD